MEKSIEYAIWLKENCENGFCNAYCLKVQREEGRDLYYIDSQKDMEELYNIFANS